jgi:hypothetical protein
VNAKIIEVKACEIAREKKITGFKASQHWVQLFIKRWEYSLCWHTSIALSSNYEEK